MPLISLSLGTLLLALAVAASPVAPSPPASLLLDVPPKMRYGLWKSYDAFNPLQHGQARAREPITRRSSTDIKVDNTPRTYSNPTKDMGDIHCTVVNIGNPPKEYNLIIDTGSSNTFFIGLPSDHAVTQYNINLGVYGSAVVGGIEYPDTVGIANMVVHNQSIAAVQVQYGISSTGCDGILGIGPTNLTEGAAFGPSNPYFSPFPTVTDNAYSQGLLDVSVVSLSYFPSPVSEQGKIFFGGDDNSRFEGELQYLPLTSQSPASSYWGIDASFQYGDARATIQPLTAGILDSGTTLLYLTSDAYKTIQDTTGAVLDSHTGLLKVTKTQFANMKSLYIVTAGITMELIPDALSVPPSSVNASSDDVYLIFGDLGKMSSTGLQFILGYFVHQRFYISYDSENQRVGLAPTEYTSQRVNNPSG